MSERDIRLYFADILDSCKAIAQLVEGFSYVEFRTDRKTYSAAIREFEIIGEAVGKLPEALKSKRPEVEWQDIKEPFHYTPVPVSAEDLELMRLIDEQYLKTSTYGSRSMERHFRPDQGAPFTSDGFTQILNDHEIAIRMDGRGRCQDNIFVERLSRTIKHHYLYPLSFSTGAELRQGLEQWIRYHNHKRGHFSLDNRTPGGVCYGMPHPFAEAA